MSETSGTSNFSWLPTNLLLVIQTFLSFEDYKSLMDCNITTFGNAKYETACYHINNPQRWLNKDPSGAREEFFYRLINEKVKDKSKQITVKMEAIPLHTVLRCIYCFAGIHHLVLFGVTCEDSEIDFNLFNGINHVELSRFDEIESISSGFENVIRLEIEFFDNLQEITNINMSKTLKVLKLSHCNRLTSLDFSRDNLEGFHLNFIGDTFNDLDTIADSDLLKLPKLTELSLTLPHDAFHDIPVVLSSLQSFYFFGNFTDCKIRNYRLLENISDLTLESCGLHANLLLQRFNGHRLRLERFNLTQFLSRISNNPEAFKTLRSLDIESCKGLVHLPSLPNLRELLIVRCDDLNSIATMSKLRDLTCAFCDELVSISPDQPRLTTCWIKACRKLSDFDFANPRMERFGMLHCPCVAAVSMLGQVKSVDIIAWTQAAPIAHICDLSTSANHVEKLLLDHIERFTTCEGIHHIDHLQIKRCDSLTSTAGLSNIFKVLEIGSCPNLTSLVDVEDIPLIAFEGKLNIDINTMKDRFVISCEDKEAINEDVQVFGLIRMREELETDPRWQKLIRSLFKIET